MAKNDNLTDFLTDVADAIREKKGTTEKINPQEFSNEIASIKTSSSIWTGHVDVEGLKAIGWDDEDIAYYQEHGVNWMEEDDEYYKVSDDNKALYGVLTADNIQEYKDRIVWLPKIDFSGATAMNSTFKDCSRMIGIPMLDIGKVTSLHRTFNGCVALSCIPRLDTSKVTYFGESFRDCVLIREIYVDLSSAETLNHVFYFCQSLTFINPIIKGNYNYSVIAYSPSLVDVRLYGIKENLLISGCHSLSVGSVLYMIENEAATEAITITLTSYSYKRVSNNPDIVAALAEHPLVSLASA